AVRLSGLVLVVTTAPGASRMALMTTCRPLPDLGGPMSSIESSTEAQTCLPRAEPRRYPTSFGDGLVSEGRSVLARRRSAFSEATRVTSLRVAVPARR